MDDTITQPFNEDDEFTQPQSPQDELYDHSIDEKDINRPKITEDEEDALFNLDGSPTPTYNRVMHGKTAEKLGLISPEADGFIKETLQSSKLGFMNVKRGFANSLGMNKKVEAFDHLIKSNPQLGEPNTTGFSDPSYLGYTLGSTFSTVAPVMAATTIAGLLTGGSSTAVEATFFVGIFAQDYGNTLETIKQEAPDLDSDQQIGLALLETTLKALLLTKLGVQGQAARTLAKGAVITTLKRGGSKESLRILGEMSSPVWRYSSGVRGVAQSSLAFGVINTELRFVHELEMRLVADKRFSDLDVFISDFLTGTIQGAMLGIPTFILHSRNKSALEKAKKQVSEDTIAKVHSRVNEVGDTVFDIKGKQLTDSIFTRFRDDLVAGGKMAMEDADAFTTQMRNVSYYMAEVSGKAPQEFIQIMDYAFITENLTPNDVNVLRGLKGDQEKSYAYMNKRFDMNKRITSVLNEQTAQEIEIRNKERLGELEAPSEVQRKATEDRVLGLENKWKADQEAKVADKQAKDLEKQQKKAVKEGIKTAPDQIREQTGKKILTPEEARANVSNEPIILSASDLSIGDYFDILKAPITREDGSVVTANRNGEIIIHPPFESGAPIIKSVERIDTGINLEGTEIRRISQQKLSIDLEAQLRRKQENDYLSGAEEVAYEVKAISDKVKGKELSQRLNEAKKAKKAKALELAEKRRIRREKIAPPINVQKNAKAKRAMSDAIIRRKIGEEPVVLFQDTPLTDVTLTPERQVRFDAIKEDIKIRVKKAISDKKLTEESDISKADRDAAKLATDMEAEYIPKNLKSIKELARKIGVDEKLIDNLNDIITENQTLKQGDLFQSGDKLVDQLDAFDAKAKEILELAESKIAEAKADLKVKQKDRQYAEPSDVVLSLEGVMEDLRIMLKDPNLAHQNAEDLISKFARFNIPEAQLEALLNTVKDSGAFTRGIKGAYFSNYNLAVFYGKADAGVVMHEWVHHLMVQGLMPDQYNSKLRSFFNNDKDVWSEKALKDISDSFIQYIRDGSVPAGAPQNIIQSFDHVKEIFARTYEDINVLSKTEGIPISPEIKNVFDSAFGFSTDPIVREMGDALHSSVSIGDAGTGQVLYQSEHGIFLTRKKLNAAVHGKFRTHEEARKIAHGLFFPETPLSKFSMKMLSDKQLNTLLSQSKGYLGNKTAIEDANIKDYLLNKFGKKNIEELTGEDRIEFETQLNEAIAMANNEFTAVFDIDVTREKLIDVMEGQPKQESMRPRAGKGPIAYQKIKAQTRELLNAERRNTMSLARLFFYLDGSRHDGTFSRTIGRVLRSNWKKKADLNTMDDQHLNKKIFNEGKINTDSLNKYIEIGRERTLLEEGTIVDIASKARDPESRKSLIESNSEINEQLIKECESFVNANPNYKKLTKVLDDFYQRKYDQYNPVYVKQNGKKAPHRKNYRSMQRANGAYAEHDTIIDLVTSDIRTARPKLAEKAENFMKERGAIKGSRITIGNPVDEAIIYGQVVNNYIAKSVNVRKLLKMIDAKDFKESMNETFGEDMATWSHLDKMLRLELYTSGRETPLSETELLSRKIRNNTTIGMIAGRPTSVLIQPFSIMNALSITPGGAANIPTSIKYGSKYFSAIVKNATSRKKGIHLLEGTEVHQLWQKYNPELLRRWGGEPELENARRQRNFLSGIKIGKRSASELLMSPFRDFDTVGVAVSWMTAYESHLSRLVNTMDIGSAKREAAEQANMVVERSQPNANIHQRALIARENEHVKGFIPFSGQTLNNFQEFQTGVIEPLYKAATTGNFEGVLTAKPGDTSVMQKVVFGMFLPGLAIGFMRRRRMPSEDEIVKDMFIYPFTSVPVLGPVVGSLMMQGISNPTITPIYLQWSNNLFGALTDVAKDEVDLTGKTGKDLVRTLSAWTGLPDAMMQASREMMRSIDNGEDFTSISKERFFEVMQLRIAKPSK